MVVLQSDFSLPDGDAVWQMGECGEFGDIEFLMPLKKYLL